MSSVPPPYVHRPRLLCVFPYQSWGLKSGDAEPGLGCMPVWAWGNDFEHSKAVSWLVLGSGRWHPLGPSER